MRNIGDIVRARSNVEHTRMSTRPSARGSHNRLAATRRNRPPEGWLLYRSMGMDEAWCETYPPPPPPRPHTPTHNRQPRMGTTHVATTTNVPRTNGAGQRRTWCDAKGWSSDGNREGQAGHGGDMTRLCGGAMGAAVRTGPLWRRVGERDRPHIE